MTCPINPGDWRTVKAWAEGELAWCNRALEYHTPEIQTAAIRGRVTQLRRLLEWGDPTPDVADIEYGAAH